MKVELKDPALFVFLSMSVLCHIPFHWFSLCFFFFKLKEMSLKITVKGLLNVRHLQSSAFFFFLDDSHHSNTSCCTVLSVSFSWSFIILMIYVVSA